ncbi:conserved hypothetical protein [Bradyrhizobium sp. STM 3809]|nr:conserved hypothetical protein [Bradyrhizobium sp. STM 3809]
MVWDVGSMGSCAWDGMSIIPVRNRAFSCDVCCSHMSVKRFSGDLSQALDLILHHQLASFQFGNAQIVGGWVQESFMQFVFKNFMLTFQFNEMRLNGHSKPPW